MDWIALIALDAANLVLVILLVAMGLVIVFGLMNVINMAHGELIMIGAYTMLVAQREGLGFWAGLAAAPLVVGLLGAVIELLVIRRIRHRFLDTILATWALSVALKQAVILAFGPGSHAVAPPFVGSVTLFGTVYPGYRLMIMGIAIAVVLVTLWLFFATGFGLRARAAMADRETTACLGIDTGRLDRWTFA
jgi:urea transport system permease protein